MLTWGVPRAGTVDTPLPCGFRADPSSPQTSAMFLLPTSPRKNILRKSPQLSTRLPRRRRRLPARKISHARLALRGEVHSLEDPHHVAHLLRLEALSHVLADDLREGVLLDDEVHRAVLDDGATLLIVRELLWHRQRRSSRCDASQCGTI